MTPLESCDMCGATTFIAGAGTTTTTVTLHGSYLGGLAQAPAPVESVTVHVNESAIYLRVGLGRSDVIIPWSEVTSFTIDGYEETRRRVTATRVALIGVFALAATKNEKADRAYLSVGSNGGEMIVRCELSPHELRARLSRFRSLVPVAGPATPEIAPPPKPAENAQTVTALVDALERLGALRSSGVLTDDEFAAAKARVLAAAPEGMLA
jgi:hypothetical protein